MKLSCQELRLPGDSLEEKWAFATGAGFEGIELRARGDGHFASRLPELRGARGGGGGAGFGGTGLRPRGDGHFASRLPELRAAVRAGVVMATVCPETDHFIGDFDP